ncbi:MAG: hypothetical protein JWO68_2255 [Actinomycetia bacterium]|nr:hypothetical protein [Actinomycetes bacterium]
MPDAIAILRRSHDRLAGLVAGLDDEAIEGPSFAAAWSIAEVCSHLGSGSELNLDWTRAAVEHREPMSTDELPKIWAVWNGRTPRQQVDEAIRADDAHVAALEALTEAELAGALVMLFDGTFEMAGIDLVRFRLSEHAVHTWDVAVALDPSARIPADAVVELIEVVGSSLEHLAKPQLAPWSLLVTTTAPDRTFVLRTTEGDVTMAPAGGTVTDGELRLPAERFVRLAYGRLLDGEALDLDSAVVTIEDLRSTFPGF